MPFDFDQIINRRDSASTKWQKFSEDVLPFWVADMDFAAPDFILDSLRERLAHPILGYTDRPATLMDAFLGWLQRHFDWQVPPSQVVFVPGVVPALNLATQTLQPGDHIIIPTPVYHPFLELADNARVSQTLVPMHAADNWQIDIAAMQAAVQPNTRMVLICNPQNPTGRCYSHAELAQLADFIERNKLVLVSDEIHANFVLDPDATHIPIARAFPDLASRTISLYAATKIYNIPGLSCAAAVIPDTVLRERFLTARKGLVPGIGPLGFVASEIAFNDRSTWITELQAYLRTNLNLVADCVGQRLSPLQATYLAWINVADLQLADTERYFADAGIGISPGAQFGQPDHIRFNFGCPRQTLETGLQRLSAALEDAAKIG